MAESAFVLWGSSGHALVLASLIKLIDGRVIATFDNDPAVRPLHGVPLHIGVDAFTRWLDTVRSVNEIQAHVAIGGARGAERVEILRTLVASGLKSDPLVHPAATFDETAYLGIGVQVLAQANVAAVSHIGDGCIINHSASVDHECVLGSGVHLAPSATLCGLVNVGDNTMIGAGAVVLPRLSIGANAVVGAGAVVNKNVAEGEVVVGNPAQPVKRNKESYGSD